MQQILSVQILNKLLKRCFHVERKVKLDRFGMNINIVQCGEKDAKHNVLLLPGALGSAWTDFKPQIEKLPQLLPNHAIIAWDPPGYGKSIPPEREFSVDFLYNDAIYAVELMCSLGISKFSLLGWSGGSITSQIIACRYPDHVEKLVFWGAGAFMLKRELQSFCDIRDITKWSKRVREPMEQLYGRERLVRLWSEWLTTMEDIYEQRQGDFCRNELINIKAPTFFLHGGKDHAVVAGHDEYMRKDIKDFRYHSFPEGRHNLHLQYPDEFNKLVADFLLEKQQNR